MISPTHTKTIAAVGKLTAILVALLAVAAFGLSFEALRDLATVAGGMKRSVSWLFPLIIDGGIVVFSLAALRASLTGADRTWFMALVVLVTGISIWLNIAHAGSGYLPAVMAAMPPLLLFLAFESLMRQVHDTVLGPEVVRSDASKSRKSRPKTLTLLSPIEDEVSVRRAKAAELLAQGMSRNKIAKEMGIALSTVRRYLADSSKAA